MSRAQSFKNSIVDDLLMVALSLASVALLIFEVVAEHTPQQLKTLEFADKSIAFIFLCEFYFDWDSRQIENSS
ncbi:MAG: hypothetical protein EOP04_12895 [Proteobacteria bacterium]|nr:MAG: hypothetical protein EOP04_12895 [Pseudomonadota bacterium]